MVLVWNDSCRQGLLWVLVRGLMSLINPKVMCRAALPTPCVLQCEHWGAFLEGWDFLDKIIHLGSEPTPV